MGVSLAEFGVFWMVEGVLLVQAPRLSAAKRMIGKDLSSFMGSPSAVYYNAALLLLERVGNQPLNPARDFQSEFEN